MKFHLIFYSLFFLLIEHVLACDCTKTSKKAEDAFKRGDLVLVGKVIKELDGSSYFKVAKVLKGTPIDTVKIFATERGILDAQYMSACDVRFALDSKFIVFARAGKNGKGFYADPCAPHCEAGAECSKTIMEKIKPLIGK